MRPPQGLCRLALLLLSVHQAFCAIPAAHDLTCKLEDVFARLFAVPPISYDFSLNTPNDCRYACFHDGHTHSAVSEDWLCLCSSQTTAAVSALTADAGCTEACAGDVALTCGGLQTTQVHAYQTPNVITDVTVNTPAGTLRTYEPSTINLVVTGGDTNTYSLDMNDRATPAIASTATANTYAFRGPGAHDVRVTGTDVEGNTAAGQAYVQVETAVSGVSLTCPPAWPINQKLLCDVHVAHGTAMAGTVSLGNSDPDVPMPMENARPYKVGSVAGTNTAGATTASKLYLMINDHFAYNGTLAGWDYHATGSGALLDLMIFRPICDDGFVFCYKSYSCIVNTTSCKAQSNKWARTCPAGFKYSASRRECMSTTVTGDTQPVLLATDWASMPVQKYDVVYRHPQVTVSAPAAPGGIVWEDALSSNFVVQAGDIPGFMINTANVLGTEAVSGGFVELTAAAGSTWATQDIAAGIYYSFPDSQTVATEATRHMVRTHIDRFSMFRFKPMYSVLGVYTLTATVTNVHSPGGVTSTAEVDIQELITGVDFTCPYVVATNGTVTFGEPDHTGNKVTYVWQFGDGEWVNQTTKPRTHVYTRAGVYFVSMRVYNKISEATNNCTVIIQDTIEDLTVVPAAIATIFKQPALVDVAITQGTNVTYDLHPGDGTLFSFNWNGTDTPDWVTPKAPEGIGFGGRTAYNYSAIGNFTYRVNCSNLVSSAEATVYMPVQIVIEGLSIIQPPPIAHGEFAAIYMKMDAGSHVEFTNMFNGSEARNWTMSDVDRRGRVILEPQDFPPAGGEGPIGPFDLVLTGSNLVGPMVTDSVTVWVDYRLTDVSVRSDLLYVVPGTVVTFTTSLLRGSRFYWNRDYDDTLEDQAYYGLVESPAEISQAHTFTLTHNHTVTSTFVSPIDNQTFSNLIIVQDPVVNLTMACSTPNPIPKNGVGQTTCQITRPVEYAAVPNPTDIWIEFGWNDTTDPNVRTYSDAANTQTIIDGTYTQAHSFDQFATYNATLNVSNLVSHQWFEQAIVMDQNIVNPVIAVADRTLRVNEDAQLNLTMEWGSRYVVNWNYNDGSSIESYSYWVHTDTMTTTHAYSAPGYYQPSVNVVNSVHPTGVDYTLPLEGNIIVEWPIENFKLWCEPSALLRSSTMPAFTHRLACNITVAVGTPYPTNAQYEVDFGDGNTQTAQTLTVESEPNSQQVDLNTDTRNHVVSFVHLVGYTQGGKYTISVRVWNNVDDKVFTATTNIYAQIFELSKVVMSGTGNASAPSFEGGYFPLEKPILFETSYTRGSHVLYSWNYGDGQTETTNETSVVHSYAAPGDFYVVVNASNPLSTASLNRIVRVQRSISGMSIVTEQNPHPKNRTFVFTLDAGSMGTDACYYVDFGDDKNATTLRHYFSGNSSECQRSFPDLWKLTHRYEEITNTDFDTNGRYWVVSHHYMIKGQYPIKMMAANRVSSAELTYTVTVTKGPCAKPNVSFSAVSSNRCTPNVDCKDGRKTFFKKQSISISAKVTTKCEATNIHNYNWTMFKKDEDSGEFVDYVYSDKDFMHEKQVMFPARHTLAQFKPKMLPYGVYKLCLVVEMHLEQIQMQDCYEFEVIKSPLQGGFEGGSDKRMGWNFNYTLRVERLDPDCNNLTEDCSKGWTLEVYCSRACDDPPSFDDPENYRGFNPKNWKTQCTDYMELGRQEDMGCFWQGNQSHAEDMAVEVPGVYSVNRTGGTENIALFDINTLYLYELDSHKFFVVMRRDTRMFVAYLNAFITKGMPPDAGIAVTQNVNFLYNIYKKGNWESRVKGARGVPHEFAWSIYEMVGPEGEEEEIKKDRERFRSCTSTGLDIDNLSVKENTLVPANDYHEGHTYKLKVIVRRKGSDPNNYAEPSYMFKINKSPVAGKCFSTPTTGVAMETEFSVTCDPAFIPNVHPYSYQLFTSKNGDNYVLKMALTAFEVSIPGSDSPAKTFQLGNGLKDTNYTMYLKLRCIDAIGTYTDVYFTTQVMPPPMEKLDDVMAGLTSGGSGGSEMLDDLVAQGDVNTLALVFFMAFAPDTDTSSTSTSTNSTATTAKSEVSEAEKAAVANAVNIMTSLPITDPVALASASNTMSSIVSDPEAVTADAADSIANFVTANAAMIDVGDQDSLSSSLGLIGNALSATSSLQTPSGNATTAPTEDEAAAQEKAAKAMEMLKQAMESLTDAISNNMVYGEGDNEVSTAAASLAISKPFTRTIMDYLKEVGCSASDITLPPITSLIPLDPVTNISVSYTVDIKVKLVSANTHPAANQSSVIIDTPTVIIDMKNDEGSALGKEHNSESFEFDLENRNPNPQYMTHATTAMTDKMDTFSTFVNENHTAILTILPPGLENRDPFDIDREAPETTGVLGGEDLAPTRKRRATDAADGGPEWVTLFKVFIGLGDEKINTELYDHNCTLPLTNKERIAMVQGYNRAIVDDIPQEVPTTAAPTTTTTTVPLEQVDECLSSPCQNNGTCTDLLGGYKCTCTKKWLGDNCNVYNYCPDGWEVVADHCVFLSTNFSATNSTPGQACENETAALYEPETMEEMTALLTRLPNNTRYRIAAKWNELNQTYVWEKSGKAAFFNTSALTEAANVTQKPCVAISRQGLTAVGCDEREQVACHTAINECSVSPCENGGTCKDKVGTYSCTCPSGYSGKRCQTPNYCLSGWLPYKSGCVLFAAATSAHQDNATARCEAAGGQVKSFSDATEEEEFRGRFSSAMATSLSKANNSALGGFFLSAKRAMSGNESVWLWVKDGVASDPAHFTDDNIGGAGDKNCSMLVPGQGIKATSCKENQGYICYNPDPIANDCDASPCKNGATCVDVIETSDPETYTCHCAQGFEGPTCEINTLGTSVVSDVPKRYKLPDAYGCFLEAQKFNFTEEVNKVKYGVKSILVWRSKWINATSAGEVWDDAWAEKEKLGSDPEWADTTGVTNYTHYTRTPSCVYWRQFENSDDGEWSTYGVQVLAFSSQETTFCATSHLSEFASSFVQPMNTFDPSDSAFLKLDENPLVFAVMVCLMCLYLVFVIWARKADQEDETKAGTTPLVDNDPRDKYLYELTVFTGARTNGGTSAKVRFILTGEAGDTGPRLLWDDKRPVLQRGATDAFIMACRKPLGVLTHIRLWHDNSGKDPSWFFSRMMVHDLQTQNKYFFICDRWLAVEHDDGMLDRIVPIAGHAELTSFNHLFWTKTRKSLTDGHLWFSVFQRPPTSRFTRVQRLTCVLALLFSSMLVSIMFYKTDNEAPTQVFRIGPISFTPQQIYKGIISGLIAFVPNMIILCLFRYAREPPRKKKEIVVASAENFAKYRTQSEEEDFASELERQREFLDTGNDDKRLLTSARGTRSRVEFGGVAYIDNVNGEPQVVPVKEEPASPPPKDKKKKKGGFALPWWSIYVGYGFSLCVIGVAFWATVEFAGVFGPDKARDWLISFCISIVESVFLSQPLKVIIVALVLSLVWKKPETNEEDERPSHLKPNEEWVHNHMTEKDMEDPDKRREIEAYKDGPLEMDPDIIKAAREERFKEMQMQKIIREIIVYFIWLWMMMMVAYGNRDPWSYIMNANYQNMFIQGAFHPGAAMATYNFRNGLFGDKAEKISYFNNIHSRPDFWQYIENVYVPTLYGRHWYDENATKWQDTAILDGTGYLVGEARLRQQRVHPYPCKMPVYRLEPECKPSFGFTDEDDGIYAKGWKNVNVSDASDNGDPMWRYQTWQDLDGYPYWGKQASYSGGGYVANLGHSQEDAERVIAELIEHQWLDEFTRVVFLEFLVYNPNINLFAIGMSAVEFTDTGSGFALPKYHVMRLDRYFGQFMFVVMGAEIITVLLLVFFMVREAKFIYKEGKAYFKSIWNCIEVFVLSCSIVAIAMFAYRLLVANLVSSDLHDDPHKFHNFQYVAMWDDIYAYFLGIIITFATIKFLKLLRFNKKMGLLTATIRHAWPSLWQFLIMFLLLFFAFVQIAFLIFSPKLYEFSTFIVAAETLFSVMLGKFDFYRISEAEPVWGPFLILSFCIFIAMILVNFFIAIIIESYEHVKEDLANQPNDHEIVDFMMDKFKITIGVKKPQNKSTARLIADKKMRQEKQPDQYEEGADENAPNSFYLRQRVETMLGKLETLVNLHHEDKDVMKELENMSAEKKKRKIFVS